MTKTSAGGETAGPGDEGVVRGTGVVPGVAYAQAVWAKPHPHVELRSAQVREDQR